MNWDTVTRLKDHGGLGIHESRMRNLALLAKLDWRLLTENSSPWAHVLNTKYLTNNATRNPWTFNGSCSRIWATCKAAKPLLDSRLRKVITIGASTSLWYDDWILNGSLRAQLIGSLNVGAENQLVSQVIDNYGNLHLQLSFDLPENLVKLIQDIPTNINSQVDDSIAWAFTNDGNFSLWTAYNVAKGLNVLNQNTPSLSWIWKLNVPPKFILFI